MMTKNEAATAPAPAVFVKDEEYFRCSCILEAKKLERGFGRINKMLEREPDLKNRFQEEYNTLLGHLHNSGSYRNLKLRAGVLKYLVLEVDLFEEEVRAAVMAAYKV